MSPGDYVGEKVPRWFVEGAQVRVKATPILRRHGLHTYGALSAADDRAWPGEVGTVEIRNGLDWWEYRIVFPRHRGISVSPEVLASVTRVQPPR